MYKKEIWKDITNYEGIYQVSNLGRLKSFDRFDVAGRRIKGRVMKGRKDPHGYSLVTLYGGDGSRKDFLVHRLVMLAFHGRSDLQVNHINGVKTDNRLENLEYCSQSHNIKHAFELGLMHGSKGERNGRSKLTEEQVREIRHGNGGLTQKEVAAKHGIDKAQVYRIRLGKTWKHIL